MRKALACALATLALTTSAAQAQSPFQAGQSVPITLSATPGTTQLVAGVAGKWTLVSHYLLSGSGANSVVFEASPVANCASSVTLLSGAITLAAGTNVPDGDGAAPILFVPSGDNLCAVTTGSTAVGGFLSHIQR